MGTDTLELEYDYYLSLANLYDTTDLDVSWDWKNQHNNNEMPSSNSQRIGAISESRFITECLERDFEPHVPTTPMPWDFIVTCPAGILKVQIKSTTHKASTNSYALSTNKGVAHKASMCDTIDVVGCYVIPEDTWWMIPRKQIKALSIKLSVLPQSKSRYKKYQENWSIFYE